MIEIDSHSLTVALHAATTRYINSLAPDLPPLHWSLDDRVDGRTLVGQVPIVDYPDPAPVAAQWCTALDLTGRADEFGTRRFVGRWSGMLVDVWFVFDRDEFES